MSSSYRLSLENWLKELDVKADRVLDIGGSQLPVKDRVKSWDVKEYSIADLPEPHVGSPEPDWPLDLNSPESWDIVSRDWDEKYNLVFCLEVFEYVWNPVMAMRYIHALLERGGTAWVTFQSFYPLHQPVEDDALRYMPGGIKKLADHAGLTILQMIPRRPETDAIQRAFLTERMRPAKGEDHNVMGYICEFQK